MSSVLPPIPHQAPMIDPNGFTTPIWSDWFQKVSNRIGGNIANTNTEIAANGFTTFANIQNINGHKVIGRDASTAGVSGEIGVSGGVEFDGSGNLRTSAFTGDVTKSAGGTALSIPAGSIAFAKLLATDWTDSNAASGYQKLPSGMYLQWGVTSSIASGTNSGVTFPIAFPGACRQVIAGIQGNSADATTSTGQWGTGVYTASGFTLFNRTSLAQTFNWFAVGY